MTPKGIVIALIIFIGFLAFTAAYTVDETEQVVITQFGRVVGESKTEPGLYFKIPLLQVANYFPKNLLEWDGDPGQIPTLDKTYIWVDTFARWKIIDPVKFFQTVNNTVSALGRLDDIIDPAVRNYVTSYPLIETVRSNKDVKIKIENQDETDENDELSTTYKIQTGREAITHMIQDQATPKLNKFGIELVDVKIKRINYVEQVRKSVYGRMIEERNQIAEKFRAEGRGKAQEILGEKQKELKRIESEAYKSAQIIKGEADGQATIIYAKAYGEDPEFYSFTRTLEVYREALDNKSSLVLSTDSDFLKYLKQYK